MGVYHMPPLRKSHLWYLSGTKISEVDTISHLGITLSLLGFTPCSPYPQPGVSFTPYTLAGPRFGCLHPSTALELFNSFPLSILHFGLEVVFPSNSEIKMLERCQLAILCSILVLPSRAPCVAIHYLMGTLPVRLQSHLSFLHKLLSLPDSATSKAIFLLRADASPHVCFSGRINSILQEL